MFVMYDGHMKNSKLPRRNGIVDISGNIQATHTVEDVVKTHESPRGIESSSAAPAGTTAGTGYVTATAPTGAAMAIIHAPRPSQARAVGSGCINSIRILTN